MKQLQTGEFHGVTNKTIHFDGIVLTDTEYTRNTVDWHYHENAYFTFILEGNVIEGNKKEVYNCSAGSLLFHNWQEAHYNIKPEGFTRGFHIELKQEWVNRFSYDISALQGSINISDPAAKFLFYKMFMETKAGDNVSGLSVQSLLLQVFSQLIQGNENNQSSKPLWAAKIKELLHDEVYKTHTLHSLGKTLDIHPVHLSRYFPKYFQCGLGEYIRKLRVERSLSLLGNKQLSLTEIAFESGFADQSHFNRCFKDIMHITPSAFRKLILS